MVINRINRAILNFTHKRAGTHGPIVMDAERITRMHGERQVWSIAWAETPTR